MYGQNSDNTAGALDSSVVSGSGNASCDSGSSIVAGYDNDVGYNGAAQNSMIGAGQMNAVTGSLSFLGGGMANEVTGGNAFLGGGYAGTAEASGSFIGAGGLQSGNEEPYVLAGGGNTADGVDSFIGAGDLNMITSGGEGSFIGAGGSTAAVNNGTSANSISGQDSFIGTGNYNKVSSLDGFIGAGSSDDVSGNYGGIVAGERNTASAPASFIGAGYSNTISSAASYSSIVGGNDNAASGEYASIIGGYGNFASGAYSIVAGGNTNTAAGTLSYAAGYHADAAHAGSFVWSDYVSGSNTLEDTAVNQFVARASGGVYLYSNEAATSGVRLASGSGTWASLSDRNAKTDIVPLDDASILSKVAALPVSSWRYKTEGGVRHVGPMAQDFYAAFGVGEDNRHITSIDEDGVALAAIKALHRENAHLERENARLRTNFERQNSEKDASIRQLSEHVRSLDIAVAKLLAKR